ncbi:unnamed protein product [Lactuca saligna]|uniref:CG-1 domain-containing protein n=1 Tax=Lactuca saligna TaxID=75948 RepID=A0AA36E0B1_LACSI|nr:unnamed protein product [Lactuca saligna]
MMMSGYNLQDLIQEAQYRWLRPGEVFFILQNFEEKQLNHEPPQKPPSGSVFLFNKRVLRFFRKDGHSWRRKKDGKNVGEAHERLKVGNVEALSCYYAHGEQNPNFQRRSYWMLDPGMEHIVLVHYRDITIGKHSAGPISTLMLGSSNIVQGSNSYTTSASEYYEHYNSTSGPSSVEVSPDLVITSNGATHFNQTESIDGSPDFEINQALRKLEEQLSLDHLKDIGTFYSENEYANELGFTISEQDLGGSERLQYGSDNYVSLPKDEFAIPSQQTLFWKDMQKYNESTTYVGSLESYGYPLDENEVLLPQPRTDNGASNESSILASQEVEISTFPKYVPANNMYQSDADVYSTLFDLGQIETPLASDSSLTIAQEQKFTIREISPDWGYATETTKVLIVGSFTCDPSVEDSEWICCMFGDTEVPVEIIQEGVICCRAPPHLPGKVTICITSGNREACSEVREFEYRPKDKDKPSSLTENESTRTHQELLLLVKFVRLLLVSDTKNTITDLPEGSIAAGEEDSWGQVIDALSDGSLASSKTTDWLLEQLLKDKFQRWISNRCMDENALPTLSKKEQELIHMVSGLGFVWALTPILKAGVGINFRDVSGWTALHWAARFGREKMVAEVLACGANTGAVTDPCQQDPNGQTPASIAAQYGHQGLAGYLSEMALTAHLSSLTLQESQLSKGSADVEAERTVNSISDSYLDSTKDQVSLKSTLAAVRNAAQAAARIQAAFRAHSFKKRKQREAAAEASASAAEVEDEYGILPSEIQGLSTASKAVFGNSNSRDRDLHHAAALSIQKKYRGWKGRKDFLALRQKVVKIQAHVRGYQARKNYETICWAVGIVEKIVLRWYRKGAGLRGFHVDSIIGEEEDFVKALRKQKVDAALTEAVSRVLSMVQSQPARQQYHRMLHKYRLAKAQRGDLQSEGASTSEGGMNEFM